MGETISYSSGKVPESEVDRLARLRGVQEVSDARQYKNENLEMARKQTDFLRARGIGPRNMYEEVCVAATEEIERLQSLLIQNGLNPEDGEPE